jgi:hypothetical protein
LEITFSAIKGAYLSRAPAPMPKRRCLRNTFFAVTNGPVLNLEQFMQVPDIFSLRMCCRACFLVTEKWRAQRVISARLLTFFTLIFENQTLRILALLRAKNAFVSGSLLLTALLDNPWPPHDMDVFCDCQPSFGNLLANLVGAQHRNYGIPLHANYDGYRHLTRVEDIPVPGPRGFVVQLLYVQDSAVRHVTQTFDLDFLKNTYDGKRLVIWHPRSVRTFCSPISLQPNPRWSKVFQRTVMYERRGFKIDVEETSCLWGGMKAVVLQSGGTVLGKFLKLGHDPHSDLENMFLDWQATYPDLAVYCLPARRSTAFKKKMTRMWRGLASLEYALSTLQLDLEVAPDAEAPEPFPDMMKRLIKIEHPLPIYPASLQF